MHGTKKVALMAGALALIAALAAAALTAMPAAKQLARARADSESAWREIAQIQAARLKAADAALDATATTGLSTPPTPVDSARHMHARRAVARAKASAGGDDLLYDAASIETWKQAQGELTGALFMLVAGSGKDEPVAPALAQLRTQLTEQEAGLAQARARFSQASAEYVATTQTTAGSAVATLLRYPDLPATL